MAVKIIRSKKSIATLNTARDTHTLTQRKESAKKPTKTKAQEAARGGEIYSMFSMTYMINFFSIHLITMGFFFPQCGKNVF